MTRICSYCKLRFGEKCGKCGSEDTALWIEVNIGEIELWLCLGCGHKWVLGSDGKTHGICPRCLEEQMATMKASLAASR